MENAVIIKKLKFLVDDYACTYTYKNDIGDYYIYANSIFKIKIYEFKQFGDLDINFISSNENFHVDPSLDRPKNYAEIIKAKRGIKAFFGNSFEDKFWTLVAEIIKEKINTLENSYDGK